MVLSDDEVAPLAMKKEGEVCLKLAGTGLRIGFCSLRPAALGACSGGPPILRLSEREGRGFCKRLSFLAKSDADSLSPHLLPFALLLSKNGGSVVSAESSTLYCSPPDLVNPPDSLATL